MAIKRLAQLLGLSAMIGVAVIASVARSKAVPVSNHTHAAQMRGNDVQEWTRSRTSGAQPTPVIASSLPVVVDGSRDPELVPDAVAYRHLFSTTTVPSNASTEQVKRQLSRLAPVGFDDTDRDTYVQHMQSLRGTLDSIAADRAPWSSLEAAGTATGQVVLKNSIEREKQVFEGTRQLLQIALTQNGVQRLELYARNHVKRHIKIYGSVPR
jgi:hypothetical protein